MFDFFCVCCRYLSDKHFILSGSAAGKIHVEVWRDFLSEIGAVSEKEAAESGFNPGKTGTVLPYHMVSAVSEALLYGRSVLNVNHRRYSC